MKNRFVLCLVIVGLLIGSRMALRHWYLGWMNDQLARTWGIDVPSAMKLVEYESTGVDFWGAGISMYRYECRSLPSDFYFDPNYFAPISSQDIKFVAECMEEIEQYYPKKELPMVRSFQMKKDFLIARVRNFRNDDKMLIIFDQKNKGFYVFEKIEGN